jgi:hypothetical protein
MTDLATAWTHDNEEYLAAALAWLRLRLNDLSPPEEPPPPARREAPDDGERRRRRRRRRWGQPEPIAALPAATGPARAAGGSAVEAAKTMSAAEESMEIPPALVILARRFGLTRFERDVLLLCVATELDPAVPALCARAHGDRRLTAPTFALAFNLFDDVSWTPVLPDRPLRRFSLIEIFQPAATPLTASALRADERVVSFIKGVTYLDDRLVPLLVALDVGAGGAELPASHAEIVERVIDELDGTPDDLPQPVIQLLGPDSPTKQLVAQHVAAARGYPLHRLPAELLPHDVGELERLARLWQRESILVPGALLLDARESWHEAGPSPAMRFVNRCNTPLMFVDTAEVLPTYGRLSVTVDVGRPPFGEQERAWRAALGPDCPDAATALAGQFSLSVPTIERIARTARAGPPVVPASTRAWTGALAETRRGLDSLAQRIDARATWDDIVLPDAQLRLLRRIADQVGQRNQVYETWGFARRTTRGLGINALFAGPSGTGKTMAAEVIANHLRLNLYRIDLSAVVSKYIGETEKNLARLFDAAEAGGVVLFFDEADALFGKRTEIRDSHDRYANIEINYLLQRMEAYHGLAILATNMKSALDSAFVRRLRFVVDLPHPARAERRLIWEKVFPEEALIGELDFDRLAKMSFSGGNVFTIALNAAFLAARNGEPIDMAHVLEAARAEARKLELPINEPDFELGPPVGVG